MEMFYTHHWKDRIWRWRKEHDQIYAVNKKLISNTIHADCKNKDGKTLHTNINQKKASVAILISDKTDFSAKEITMDREGH